MQQAESWIHQTPAPGKLSNIFPHTKFLFRQPYTYINNCKRISSPYFYLQHKNNSSQTQCLLNQSGHSIDKTMSSPLRTMMTIQLVSKSLAIISGPTFHNPRYQVHQWSQAQGLHIVCCARVSKLAYFKFLVINVSMLVFNTRVTAIFINSENISL